MATNMMRDLLSSVGNHNLPEFTDKDPDNGQPLQADKYINVESDVFHESASDAIMDDVFAFCPCGDPAGMVEYVYKMLKAVAMRKDGKGWEESRKLAVEIAGNEQSFYFFMYWADMMGFIEHGSSIGGSWIVEKGEQLIEMIEGMMGYGDE